MWYFWDSLDIFNLWHESVKKHLGLPKPGFNSETGLIDENAQWTENYTTAVSYQNGFIAKVEEFIALACPENLGNSINPIFSAI